MIPGREERDFSGSNEENVLTYVYTRNQLDSKKKFQKGLFQNHANIENSNPGFEIEYLPLMPFKARLT